MFPLYEFSVWYQLEIVDWVTNPVSWFVPGVWAQIIGVLCLGWIILDILPDNIAGGALFENRATHFASLVAAAYIVLVFVLPYLTAKVAIGLLILGIVIVIGVVMYRRTHP